LRINREEDQSGHHGCDVLYELVKPWANTDRLVVADSYFASVTTALHLKKAGLRFIGVVKTATKGFPMQYLGNVPLMKGKGGMKGLLSTDPETNTQLLAFVWIDRDRRYFIATAGSLGPGAPIRRQRWRQVDTDTPNAEPVKVDIEIDQPEAAELYYSACGKIDQHNRHRQAGLMLETKLKTMNWHTRMNLTLLGMVIVDSFLLMQGCHGSSKAMDQRLFYEKLAEELIDNTHDTVGLRPRKRSAAAAAPEASLPRVELHLTSPTPTKKKKKSNKKHRLQGRCMHCGKSTSWVCRECQIIGATSAATKDKQHWICRDKHLTCMSMHIGEVHPDRIAPDMDYVHFDS